MLILTRRPREKIRVQVGNARITFTILGFKGNQVRVGVDAPDDVDIDREEVAERKDYEREQEREHIQSKKTDLPAQSDQVHWFRNRQSNKRK